MRCWIKPKNLAVISSLIFVALIWSWWNADDIEIGSLIRKPSDASNRETSKHHFVGLEEDEIAKNSADFPSKMFAIGELRKQNLAKQCKKKTLADVERSPDNIHPDVFRLVDDYQSLDGSKPILPRLFVSDKYKLVFCAIEGVESDAFAKYIGIMEEGETSSSFKPRLLWNYRRDSIAYRLEKYYKVMFARNPLARLLVLYKQYNLGSGGNGRSSPEADQENQSKFSTIYDEYLKTTDMKLPNFVDFVTFFTHQSSNLESFYELCMPCSIHYDFIGKIETLEDDFTFIKSQIGFTNDDKKLSTQFTAISAREVHKNLTFSLSDRLYEMNSYDFSLFGYSYP